MKSAAKFHLLQNLKRNHSNSRLDSNEWCINCCIYDSKHFILFCGTAAGELFKFNLKSIILAIIDNNTNNNELESLIMELKAEWKINIQINEVINNQINNKKLTNIKTANSNKQNNNINYSIVSLRLVDNPYSIIIHTSCNSFVPIYSYEGQFLCVLQLNQVSNNTTINNNSDPINLKSFGLQWNFNVCLEHTLNQQNQQTQQLINQIEKHLQNKNSTKLSIQQEEKQPNLTRGNNDFNTHRSYPSSSSSHLIFPPLNSSQSSTFQYKSLTPGTKHCLIDLHIEKLNSSQRIAAQRLQQALKNTY
jgi:hypothetical protein